MKASSLSKSFILRVLLVLLGIQAGIFFMTYRFELAEATRALEYKADIVGRLIAHASERVLEESDVTDVGLLIDESLKDKDFVFFKLEDNTKYVAIERQGVGVGKADKVNTYIVTKGAEPVGTLSVGYSLGGVNKTMAKRMLAKGGEIALLLVSLSVVIIILFKSSVGSRVKTIEAALGKATHGDLTVRIDDNRNDEISRIAEGVNYLVEQLRASFVRIAGLSESSTKTTGALVASFDESINAMAEQQRSAKEISTALKKAGESYALITNNTHQLHLFSEQNTLALQQSVSVSKDIAERIDRLNSAMNDAHITVAAISKAAAMAAKMAEEATSEAQKGSSSADNVRSSVAMITEVISQSAVQSERTSKIVSEKGMIAVSKTTASMEEIHLLTEALTASMQKLDAGSQDIAKIISVIEEIAKRTRLLSLNTSIIAAQAGEHGKSFMVVANEMKQLSDQTANHTMEIAGIIGSIQDGIGDAAEKTRDASRQVEDGIVVVASAGEALAEILEASQSSAAMVRKVMGAAKVQQSGLEEILTSLGCLEKLNTDVSKAMINEQGNIGSFASTIERLCESMEIVSSSTEEQVVTMQHVMTNLLGANEQISQISTEIVANEHENLVIADSVATVVNVTNTTVQTLNEASVKLKETFSGIDQLRQEMDQFTL